MGFLPASVTTVVLGSKNIAAVSRQFVVCVHDVHPGTTPAVAPILEALRPLVGNSLSLAVVPRPGGTAWPTGASANALRRALNQSADEVLLHGLTHRRGWSLDPLSWLIGRSDELAGLSPPQVQKVASKAMQIIQAELGREVRGVVPPGWRSGCLRELLGSLGLSFLIGMRGLVTASGNRRALATWSWDAGPVAAAGWLLEFAGSVAACGGATPVVVLHPADLKRGFVPRALRRIRLLLDAGHLPVSFEHLAQSTG